MRKAGYFREYKEKWRHTREVAYYTYLAIPEKGKKISIEQFMNLDGNSGKQVSNEQKELLKEAYKRSMEEAKRMKEENGFKSKHRSG